MFSLLTLLDDIATTFDDVAVMTKVAMTKTSALMSDDLAVNADVVTGVSPHRELPMVRAIFVGSLFNKLYCIAGVLLFTAVYPPILKAILLIGGLYLSYEGAHKVLEKLLPSHKVDRKKTVLNELQKVKGAIRTDLILSIEIIVIAKNSITGNLLNQSLSLLAVGLGASIIIYGLVAILVKLDDLGLYLVKNNFKRTGMLLVNCMPYTMKALGIIGTLAMFLVGGGIISHTFHFPLWLPELLQNLILGLICGVIICTLINFILARAKRT